MRKENLRYFIKALKKEILSGTTRFSTMTKKQCGSLVIRGKRNWMKVGHLNS